MDSTHPAIHSQPDEQSCQAPGSANTRCAARERKAVAAGIAAGDAGLLGQAGEAGALPGLAEGSTGSGLSCIVSP
jgi:hypothetical protein